MTRPSALLSRVRPAARACGLAGGVALGVLALGGVAQAQTPAPPPPPAPVSRPIMDERVPAPRVVSGTDAGFALAQRLLAAGQPDEAIPLLEDLVAREPDNLPVWLRLKDAYAAARRYDDALALLDAREARDGRSALWSAARGGFLHQAGRADAARAAWNDALAAAPDDEQTYRTVAQAQLDVRLYALAAETYAAGRERLGRDGLFDVERAAALGADLRYAEAADLYFALLAREERALGGVRGALTRLLDGEGAPEAFEAAAARALAQHPTSRGVRALAGWLALERGDYTTALDATRALDRLDRLEGRGLVAFAEQAAGAGALDAARAALDEALERYPDGPAAWDARAARARLADLRARESGERSALGATPFAEAARADYRAAVDARPSADDLRLALARLERDVFADFEAASALFEAAAAGADPDASAAARLDLGDVAVRAGRLDDARLHFTTVEETARLGAAADQSRFELALLDFYEELVYSALARVEAMDDNTAADASNDAISLRVTLQENITEVGGDTLSAGLQAYARAALLHRQGRGADALSLLDSLTAALPGHPTTDEALFLSAQTLHALGRTPEAVARLDALAAADPTSFFRDRALLLQGEWQETSLGDAAGAMERYERLLVDFPASLFAPEARARLRRLRAPS